MPFNLGKARFNSQSARDALVVRAVDLHNAVTKVKIWVWLLWVAIGVGWVAVPGSGGFAGGLGEELDLGLGVVGCCDWVSGGLLRLGIVIGLAVEEEIWVLVAEVYGVDC
uniref:Uncharacterized protein n=1 Tax=Fagus sylvatica TaxID=28930 RepID=A0A2N9IXT6_FAGSY